MHNKTRADLFYGVYYTNRNILSVINTETDFPEEFMKKILMVTIFSALLFGGCAIGLRGGSHGQLIIAPALPVVVDLDADNYYVGNGYYYVFRNDVWFYSDSREGPWDRLPKSHYPHEVRGHNQGQGHDRDQGPDRGRDHDNRR